MLTALDLHHPAVMGILNITPDSFYDGGSYVADEAIMRRARQILDEGGSIIDVGAVSTRPGAQLLSPEAEAARLTPVVSMLRHELPEAFISVDTCYSLPAIKAVEAGANMVNDISGGQFDPQMIATMAQLQVPYVLSHTRGTPDTMQQQTHYDNLIEEIRRYFADKLETLYRLGSKSVILDPGFGFAKTLEQNYELLDRLDELVSSFQEPWLIGISRKSMIYRRLGTTPQEALIGTTALHAKALMKGASLLRVHDVRAAVETIKVITL